MTPGSTARGSANAGGVPVPITDFHVHLSEQLTIEGAVALAAERGQRFGIVEHPGSAFSTFGLDSDAELRASAAGRPDPGRHAHPRDSASLIPPVAAGDTSARLGPITTRA